jgi:hypothetical protein
MKIYCHTYPGDWDLKVVHLAYAYNTTVHTALEETPFFCLHGYHPISAYTLYLPCLENPALVRGVASEVSRFRREHALALQKAHSALQVDAQRRHAAAMPAQHRMPKFKAGDHVSLSIVHLPKDEFVSKLPLGL